VEFDFGSDYSQATTSGPDFSSSSMGLSDEAMASIGSDENQDQSFLGGPDTPNIMDFGRGSVSNIRDTASYDPNFAALGMIGRGLTPNSVLRNQISFDVPNQMLPQLEGSRGPLAPKFYSPVERALVEMEPVGLMAMAGKAFTNFMKDNFTDAKSALGKIGDAAGGLSLSDLMSGAFSSETGQNAVNDMADNVAFDDSGNRIDLADTRQIADFPQGPSLDMIRDVARTSQNIRLPNNIAFDIGYDRDPLIDIPSFNENEEIAPFTIYRDRFGKLQRGRQPIANT
jgi:hypothetical protein|tara:strand:+ start:228 stop:1079 length:852 start_codon:yes stop_codon:yes gene_type:complete